LKTGAASSLMSRRSTVAVVCTMALSFSAALLDLASCQKRTMVASATMAPITMVALTSSVR